MTKYKYFGDMCRRADEKQCYYRASRKRFLECWDEEEIEWAKKHNFIEFSYPKLNLGEKDGTYYEFTKSGEKWFRWYCWPLKYKIKYWFRKIFRK